MNVTGGVLRIFDEFVPIYETPSKRLFIKVTRTLKKEN